MRIGGIKDSKQLRLGERNKLKLKQEIERMWLDLESTYGNQSIIKVENSLEEEKLRLMQLFSETKGQANVRKEQSKALD